MIKRYSRAEMTRVWSDRNRYVKWLAVELEVCAELAATGFIPAKDWALLQRKGGALLKQGGVDPEAVDNHERITRHDVIAFTTAVADRIGPVARYIHFGLTSSDVVDTSLSLMLQEAGALILQDVNDLIEALEARSVQYRALPTIGRSHGIFAEPTSFGLKFLSWRCEWERNRARLVSALEGCRVGKLSGAVGVNAHWSPRMESRILKRLDLERDPVSTQVIARDRHAELMAVLSLCGSSIERIAVELRHLQRSEVAEVMEGFRPGQKGSSAMPHKRNPISSENLTGCARLLRGYSHSTQENVALWHERDISHSSVERIAFPDAFTILDYALDRLTGVVRDLVVNEDRIRRNLEAAGDTVFSGHILLALVRKGATREDAYAWVQRCALDSMDGQASFLTLLEQHSDVRSHLGAKRIRELCSLSHQLRHVDEIYKEASRSSIGKSSRKPKKSARKN